jgi:hypothetical protein
MNVDELLDNSSSSDTEEYDVGLKVDELLDSSESDSDTEESNVTIGQVLVGQHASTNSNGDWRHSSREEAEACDGEQNTLKVELSSSEEKAFEARYGIPLEYAQGSLFSDEPLSYEVEVLQGPVQPPSSTVGVSGLVEAEPALPPPDDNPTTTEPSLCSTIPEPSKHEGTTELNGDRQATDPVVAPVNPTIQTEHINSDGEAIRDVKIATKSLACSSAEVAGSVSGSASSMETLTSEVESLPESRVKLGFPPPASAALTAQMEGLLFDESDDASEVDDRELEELLTSLHGVEASKQKSASASAFVEDEPEKSEGENGDDDERREEHEEPMHLRLLARAEARERQLLVDYAAISGEGQDGVHIPIYSTAY